MMRGCEPARQGAKLRFEDRLGSAMGSLALVFACTGCSAAAASSKAPADEPEPTAVGPSRPLGVGGGAARPGTRARVDLGEPDVRIAEVEAEQPHLGAAASGSGTAEAAKPKEQGPPRPAKGAQARAASGGEPASSARRDYAAAAPAGAPAALAPAAERPAGGAAPAPGGASSTPALSPELVAATVRRHLVSIRACYERALAASPGLSGALAVTFTIQTDGGVKGIGFGDSPVRSPELEPCIAQAFARIRFPPLDGGGTLTIRYPLNLSTSP